MTNNRGFTLLEVMMYAGLAGFVTLVGFSILVTSKKVNNNLGSYVGLLDVMDSINRTVKDDTAFANTITANPSAFACYKSGTDCANAGSAAFTLMDRNNVWLPTTARAGVGTDGLTLDGMACTTYSGAGNVNCPFRYDLTWSPVCPATGDCINPLIQVTATFTYSLANKQGAMVLNPNAYKIVILKTSFTATLAQDCQATGGVPGANGSCSHNYLTNSCTPPNYLVGFDNNGNVICQTLVGAECHKGQVLVGVVAGQAVCGPGCTDKNTTEDSKSILQ